MFNNASPFDFCEEFRVVLFLEGPLTEPKTRLSRRVVQRLDALGLPFKASRTDGH